MAQTLVFVSAAATNDNGDGLSWENAKKTIAAGLEVAGENGTVYVKVGTYNISEPLVIPAGVSVRGGFSLAASGTDTAQVQRHLPGLNSQWNNVSICTIIIGSGYHRIATVSGLLEACVLRRGFSTDKGGGVLIDGGIVRYCVIKGCDAINENTLVAEGGGAYIRNDGLLTNCVITECRADKGPAVSGGNGSLINNTITRNWPAHCGTVADYDGNVYNTVVLGQQCWTKQNMRTMHYYDGTLIPVGTGNSDYGFYRYVNYTSFTSSMLSQYGYLYNWAAAMHGAPASDANPSGVTGVCPVGWHLPSDSEYREMVTFVNSIEAFRCNGYDMQIAKALASKTGWPGSNGCNVGSSQTTNNNTFFSAYPAGNYDNGFSDPSWANFWTSSQTVSGKPVSYYMNYNDSYMNRDDNSNRARARSVRCVKQLVTVEPVVHTAAVVIMSSTSAQFGGSCSDGGVPITDHGICWSTSPNPTVNANHLSTGAGEDNFTATVSGLVTGTTYYVRAYIVNANGTFYGEERSFVPADCGNMVIMDYDGNNYQTVQIGGQCWMKENLRTTHYANGDPIPYGESGYDYSNPFYYQNSDLDVSVYGLYYNWPAVMRGEANSSANPSGVSGVCPNGWHLPSHAEWEQLRDYVSSQNEYICEDNSEYNAKALASTTGWSISNTLCTVGNNPEGNNATGFNAVPAGYRGSSSYSSQNSAARFWTSSVNNGNTDYPIYWSMSYNGRSVVADNTYYRYYGQSVRCVRNE